MKENYLSASTAFSDDELALQAKGSVPEALVLLIVRYEAVAKMLVGNFRVAGLETDDLTQEALVGLVKAVRSFNPAREIPFRPYAVLCMKRQVATAVKAGLCGKHSPLFNYVPLEDNPALSFYTPQSSAVSPESIVIMEEEAVTRKEQIESLLSAFEQEALDLYLSGHSYDEMSRRLKSTHKAVDNALQRVRRKLRSMKL